MKHGPVKRKELYKVSEKGIERTKKICDRCGDGTFMAEHKDRLYCGKCGMTVWKKSDKPVATEKQEKPKTK
jgi:small subunit ribosomal protein S27Ae